MVMRIALSDIDFGPEEEQAVQRVLKSKWLSMGEETDCFEREFAAAVGAGHAIAVANGTAALHLALLGLDIGQGDTVLQPALNFVAGANMTIALGAEIAFGDICSLDEPTLSPDALRSLLAGDGGALRGRPKAVVVMHYGGYPCRMAEIEAICEEHGLALIEDACHGVGGSWQSGRMMGTIGDVGCFSFYSNKNIATGEGGMVVTNRDDVAEKVRSLRSHGMTSLTWDRHKGHAATYDVVGHGFNYRIDEIRAAIGRAQLAKLERNNSRRRELTTLYWERLAPLADLGWTLPFKSAYACSLAPANAGRPLPSCHLLPVVAPDRDTRWRCSDALKQVGIQTSLHYPFIPAFSAFGDRTASQDDSALATSRLFCTCVMTLPLFPTMTDEQLGAVCEALLVASGS